MRQKITPEASSRICSHMNEDHGLTVYGLVLSTMSKAESDMLDISKWTMKSISLSEMNLSFVVCDKKSGTCEPREISIPFVPQLRSGSEVRLVRYSYYYLVLGYVVCTSFFQYAWLWCLTLAKSLDFKKATGS